jgi:hypothetical protein
MTRHDDLAGHERREPTEVGSLGHPAAPVQRDELLCN